MEMLVQEEVSVTMTLHGHQEEGRHGAPAGPNREQSLLLFMEGFQL